MARWKKVWLAQISHAGPVFSRWSTDFLKADDARGCRAFRIILPNVVIGRVDPYVVKISESSVARPLRSQSMELWLIRHGETEWSLSGLIQVVRIYR